MIAHLLLLLLGVFVWIYFRYYKDRKFWEKVKPINGYPTLPLLGNAHQLRADLHGRYVDMIKMWNDLGRKTHKMEIGWDVYIFLSTPECVEVLLKSASNLDKPDDYSFLKPWIGEGLLVSTGAKWRRQRKIITPTFHFKILEKFIDVFNRHGKTCVNILESQVGRVIDVHPLIARCTLDIICETAMGSNIWAQKDEKSDLMQAFHDLTSVLNRRLVSPLKRFQWIFDLTDDRRVQDKAVKLIHQFSDKLIRNRRNEMRYEIKAAFSSIKDEVSENIDLESKSYRPFLDLLLLSKLPDGSPLDDEIIRDEVDTFVFEGHDTTTAGLTIALHLLSKHPEIQQKAFEEQNLIFADDLHRDVTYVEISKMIYLEAVIKESLRIQPVAYAFARKVTENLLLPDGNEMPAGVTAIGYIYGLHRNPDYFPDPDKFDPERFLNGSRNESNPFTYIPFSAGHRNCIGQKFAILEMKALLSKIIRKFEITYAGPKYEPIWAPQLIMKSQNGINIVVNNRN